MYHTRVLYNILLLYFNTSLSHTFWYFVVSNKPNYIYILIIPRVIFNLLSSLFRAFTHFHTHYRLRPKNKLYININTIDDNDIKPSFSSHFNFERNFLIIYFKRFNSTLLTIVSFFV